MIAFKQHFAAPKLHLAVLWVWFGVLFAQTYILNTNTPNDFFIYAAF